MEERRRASYLEESNLEGKNRKDAAQVPPSVLRREVGSPRPDLETGHRHHSHRGLSLGSLGHHGHHALGGMRKGSEQTT